jgi:hypothetical protein
MDSLVVVPDDTPPDVLSVPTPEKANTSSTDGIPAFDVLLLSLLTFAAVLAMNRHRQETNRR